jgi:hypothetical protein
MAEARATVASSKLTTFTLQHLKSLVDGHQ